MFSTSPSCFWIALGIIGRESGVAPRVCAGRPRLLSVRGSPR